MEKTTRVCVIGGGVVGVSVLYHLTKLGWSDVMLLERSELTSGSTWHAAANIHGLHDNTNITRIQNYTMDLYNALEAETGQSCGVFQPGSLYLAQTEAREHQLRLQAAEISVPVWVLDSSPYIVTIIVLVIISSDKTRSALNAPAALGRVFHSTR